MLAKRWRFGIFALLGACFTGCAGEPAPRSAMRPVLPPALPDPWPRFAEVEQWPPVNARSFPSRGHLVSPSHAVVRVSEHARGLYLSLITDSVMPEGCVVAMSHRSEDGVRRGPVYVMEKSAGGWSFLALGPDGRAMNTDLGACASCHAGGVADALFGLPRSLETNAKTPDARAGGTEVEWDGGPPR